MKISGLDELPSGNDALRTYNRRAAVRLGLPILKNYRGSIRLRRILIIHHVKVKVRLERIAGVPYVADRIARPNAASWPHFDASRFQVAVIAVLVVPVIDDHQVSTGRRRVWFAGNVLNNIITDGDNNAFFCGENSLAVSQVVAVGSALPPETFAVGSNLNEIVREGFGKESFVRIHKVVRRLDVPHTFKRQMPEESLASPERSRGFSKIRLAGRFVIHFHH